MSEHPLAGQPAPAESLTNIPRLVTAYHALTPDPAEPAQQVAFGTSGHRGSSFKQSFNEEHILAVTQAVCEVRARQGVTGPLFIGMDTHALSEPAMATALEVLAANKVEVRLQTGMGYTPTPVISHAILCYNRDHDGPRADGIIITPSHNPPDNGGFKYNPPHGGPAGTETTGAIENLANEYLAEGLRGVRRTPYKKALAAETTREHDYVRPYIEDLGTVVDLEAVAAAGLKVGVDPLGGASVAFWEPLAERWKLNLELVNKRVDQSFAFMPLDHDGKIRMDCSSRFAMAGLLAHRDSFDVAFGNDPDVDRHGIVTPAGLMNPNHYLAAAVWHLFRHRPNWKNAAVGKTMVSTSLIDRLARELGRGLVEVPVGFKWFVDGLLDGGLGFGGEESAGASFLRKDGTVWTTDKDGIILGLLALEITAVTGKDPAENYRELTERFGDPVYERSDAPATRAQKAALKALKPEMVTATELAGEPILDRQTHAPGNGAAFGGLKVVCESGWFAARPSGTEDVYKIYAESFKGREHLRAIQEEAKAMVSAAFQAAGVTEE